MECDIPMKFFRVLKMVKINYCQTPVIFFLTVGIIIFGSWSPAFAAEPPKIVIGSKAFTESVILGEIASGLLKSRKINNSHRKQMGGTRILWNALLRGDIDIYPEYTGTIRNEIYAGRKNLNTERSLRKALARDGIGMTLPLGFSNNYAIGLTETRASFLGVISISQLSKLKGLNLGFSNEFMDRADGWPALRQKYQFLSSNPRGLNHDLAYKALHQGKIDAMDLYTTDAEIVYYNIRVLKDDLSHFPDYQSVFLYRLETAKYISIPQALNSIENRINAIEMANLNKAVKLEKKSEKAAATLFLRQKFNLNLEPSVQSRMQRLLVSTYEHLSLVGLSLLAAVFIAVPAGILAARYRRIGAVVLSSAGIMQTIPGLAMLVFMLPILGIGAAPTIAALFLYSLLPIVRNTHAGLCGIDRTLVEAADIFGLGKLSKLARIELPLALPVILAGIKTSAIINIGTATLGAIIGAGGYGQPILTGIRLDDTALILEGAIPAAVLAIVTQISFDLLEKRVASR